MMDLNPEVKWDSCTESLKEKSNILIIDDDKHIRKQA